MNTHHRVFDSSHYLFLLWKLAEWWISFPFPALFQHIGIILIALISVQRKDFTCYVVCRYGTTHEGHVDKLKVSEEGVKRDEMP